MAEKDENRNGGGRMLHDKTGLDAGKKAPFVKRNS